MKGDSETTFIETVRRPAKPFPHHHPISKFKAHEMSVRGLLVIVKAISSSSADNTSWVIDLHAPTCDVQCVHAIVPKFSVTPVPMPVPVVVDQIVFEGLLGTRTLPKFVVEPLRQFDIFAFSDGTSTIAVPTA